MNIILHSDDINLLTYWKDNLNVKVDIVDNLAELLEYSSSLIILNYTSLGHNYKDNIHKLVKNKNYLFVLHREPSLNKAKELLAFGIKAYGNALMKSHFLLSAIDTIKDDLLWIHPEFTSAIINQLPINDNKQKDTEFKKLTLREKEVALLLCDAKRYKEIAELLDITPRTVKAHAQSIYKKLQVSDRLSLALVLK